MLIDCNGCTISSTDQDDTPDAIAYQEADASVVEKERKQFNVRECIFKET